MNNYVIINGELCHYGVKGMKWGVRRSPNRQQKRENEKKIRKELREAGYRNSFGYNASKHTKRAIVSGVGALGVAVVGSTATYALSQKGQQHAAERMYRMSRSAFDTLVFSAKVSTGMAAVNAMMGGPNAIADYRKTEKEIRSKYQ